MNNARGPEELIDPATDNAGIERKARRDVTGWWAHNLLSRAVGNVGNLLDGLPSNLVGAVNTVLTELREHTHNFIAEVVEGTSGNKVSGMALLYNATTGGLQWGVPTSDNEYDLIYYVDTATGNDITALPNTTSAYKTINAAANAAAIQGAASKRVLVYVRRGMYKETRISRDKVDMYFVDGAIVYTDSTLGSSAIITDIGLSSAGVRFNIKGAGRFYHLFNDNGSDRDAINFRYASTVNIECKEVSSVQVWANTGMKLELNDVSIIYNIVTNNNKSVICNRCTLQHGYFDGFYLGTSTSATFNQCTFILPNKTDYSLQEIKDATGTLLFTLKNTNQGQDNQRGSDITGMSLQQLIDKVNPNSISNDFTAAITYNETLAGSGDNYNNYKLRIHDPKIIVERPNCIGVRVLSHFDNPGAEFYMKNATVFNKTGAPIVGVVYGKRAGAGVLGFGIDGISVQNGVVKATPAGYAEIPVTFKTLSQDFNGPPVVDGENYKGTHAELDELRLEAKLRTGFWYEVTDHATKFLVTGTDTIITAAIEPVIIQAISPSAFGIEARSAQYPTHRLDYDFMDMLCEDNVTPRKGKITRRIDSVNRIDVGFDYLQLLHARWEADLEAMKYDDTREYEPGEVVTYYGELYGAWDYIEANTDIYNDRRWLRLVFTGNENTFSYGIKKHFFVDNFYGTGMNGTYIGNFYFPLKPTPVLFHTFAIMNGFDPYHNGDDGTSLHVDPQFVRNITIHPSSNPDYPYNNIVFCVPSIGSESERTIEDITIAPGVTRQTFVSGVSGLKLGNVSTDNLFLGMIYNTDLGPHAEANVFNGDLFNVTALNNLYSNGFKEIRNSSLGSSCQYNNFFGAIDGFKVENGSVFNTRFDYEMSDVLIQQDIYYGVILGGWQSVTLGVRIFDRTIAYDYENVIVNLSYNPGNLQDEQLWYTEITPNGALNPQRFE